MSCKFFFEVMMALRSIFSNSLASLFILVLPQRTLRKHRANGDLHFFSVISDETLFSLWLLFFLIV